MSENVQDNQKMGDSTDDHNFFYVIFGGTGSFVFIVLLAYAGEFSHLKIGGPDDWAQFATYFSGMLTPVIALISVLLLFRTLIVQQREMKESVKQLKESATISANNLKQQQRFFRLEEISQSLDKLKSSIQDHEIIFIPDQDRENFIHKGEDASSLPQGRSMLKGIDKMLGKHSVSELDEWMNKLQTKGIFLVSLHDLNVKSEIIIGYLRLGGLGSLVDNEFILIRNFYERFKTLLQKYQENPFAAEFEDTFKRLKEAYQYGGKSYRSEIDSLCDDKQAAP